MRFNVKTMICFSFMLVSGVFFAKFCFGQTEGGELPPGAMTALDQFMPTDIKSEQQIFMDLSEQRKQKIASARLLVEVLSQNEDPGSMRRLVQVLRYLGEIRAEEAVLLVMDHIDAREPFAGSTARLEDAVVIRALAKIGKASSTSAVDYLGKDKSSARAPKYLRVLYLIEGPEVGRFMLQNAAEREKDPDRKVRLNKAIELFVDADKVVPL